MFDDFAETWTIGQELLLDVLLDVEDNCFNVQEDRSTEMRIQSGSRNLISHNLIICVI